jgi:hypothetical protein
MLAIRHWWGWTVFRESWQVSAEKKLDNWFETGIMGF